MVRKKKLLETARQKTSGLKFKDLCALAKAAGFVFDRQSGSHHIYRHDRAGVPTINIQKGKSGDAKPYQVKLLLQIIEEHELEVQE